MTLRNRIVNVNEENFQYKVEYIGNPKPNIVWYQNGRVIQEENDFDIIYEAYSSTLTIKKVLVEDHGEYRARIYSFMGEAISIAELKVNTGIEVEDIKFSNERIIKKIIKIKKSKPIEKTSENEIENKKAIRIEREEIVFDNTEDYLKSKEIEKEKVAIMKEKERIAKIPIKVSLDIKCDYKYRIYMYAKTDKRRYGENKGN